MADGASERGLSADERGAIMLLAVFMAVFVGAMLFYVLGIAESILYRERLQDAADAGALSAAVTRARGMNLIVLINMVMASLLAVLVALRVIQLLASLAIILLMFSAPFGGAALASAAIPALYPVRDGAARAHQALKRPVETLLKVLNMTARATRVIVPVASQARVLDTVIGHYSPPAMIGFSIPGRFTLPVENDEFPVLCDKAGSYVASVAMLPLEPIGLGRFRRRIADAVGGLTRRASDWFCLKSGDSPPPALSETVAHVLPRLPARLQCDQAGDSALSKRASYDRACGEAVRVEQQSEPDGRGRCRTRCGLDGPYERRVQAARDQCRPGTSGRELRGFWWQEQDLEVVIERTEAGWVEVERRPKGPLDLVKKDDDDRSHPCGSESAKYSREYNAKVHPDPNSSVVIPLCTEPWEAPEGGEVGEQETVEVTEVLQVFRCSYEQTHDIGNSEEFADGRIQPSGDKSPQRVERGVELGAEDFQVRIVALGQEPAGVGDSVRIAAWGRSGTEAYDELLTLGRFAVAQAEYFYDGSEGRAEWMWNMKWRARLKRFRLPSRDARPRGRRRRGRDREISRWHGESLPESATQACQKRGKPKSGGSCSNVDGALGRLSALVVH